MFEALRFSLDSGSLIFKRKTEGVMAPALYRAARLLLVGIIARPFLVVHSPPKTEKQMWEDALSLTEEAWARALEAEGKEYENSVVIAAANALCAARRFNEIFVGGNDTSCLVQLLAIGQEEGVGDTDVLASVLLPLDDVEVAYTARGQDAYRLLCSFWTWSPTSPL